MYLEETVNRSIPLFYMATGEDLQKNEVMYLGNWKKGNPYYIVAESLVTLFPAVTKR